MYGRVLAVLMLCTVCAGAHSYSIVSSWSYADSNQNGKWDPGEDQWWDYTLSWGGSDPRPYYVGVYVGSGITPDMLTGFAVLHGGSPWGQTWNYTVTEGTGPNDATRVLWSTGYFWGFPSGAVFRFRDNLNDTTILLNLVGPHYKDQAWGLGVASNTTSAIWNLAPGSNAPNYQKTGDWIAVSPEPHSLALLSLGLIGVLAYRKRRN